MGSGSQEFPSLGSLETKSLKTKQPFLMQNPGLFDLQKMGHSPTSHEAGRIKC